jgi:hypothetical protein
MAAQASARSPIAQRDIVRLGDAVGLDRPEPLAEALASLAQKLERVRGRTPRSCALGICPVLLDQVCLESRSDFIDRLQGLVNGPVPCDIFNHPASIPCFERMDGTKP